MPVLKLSRRTVYMPGIPSHDSCKFGRDELGATRTRIARY